MTAYSSILAGVLAALTFSASPTVARAQSADLVLCDRVAADPADPDKPADVKGVAEIGKSDIATAIKFCKVASNSSRRAIYQLGRAYAADGQMQDAMAAWRRAADKRGLMTADGVGGPKDDVAARALFERAAAKDLPGAVERLGAFAISGRGGTQDKDAAKTLFREGCGARQRRRQGCAQARGVSLRAQGQARQGRDQSLFLAVVPA